MSPESLPVREQFREGRRAAGASAETSVKRSHSAPRTQHSGLKSEVSTCNIAAADLECAPVGMSAGLLRFRSVLAPIA